MSDFDNEMFAAQNLALEEMGAARGPQPVAAPFDQQEFSPVADQFEAIMMGDRTIPLNVRNAILRHVVRCMEEVSPKYKKWEEKRMRLEEVRDNVDPTFQHELEKNHNAYGEKLAARGYTEEHVDEYIEAETDMPHDPRLEDLLIDRGKEAQRLENLRDLDRGRAEFELANHLETMPMDRPITRAKLIESEIVGLSDGKTAAVTEQDCLQIIKYAETRFALDDDAEPVLMLKRLDGSLPNAAEFLAVRYGAAKLGIEIANLATALEFSDAAFRGISKTSERESIGDKFAENELFKEIENCNEIIQAGYHPMRWREAFGKSTSGMMEKMLNEWVTSGYKSLTLAQLHKLFLPAIGSSSALSLQIRDDEQDPRENKLLSAFKDLIESRKEKEIAALGED
jgi:hypothetical protein